MALLHETAGFATLFGIAARDLEEPAAFIEKDHWVTQVLRALNDAAPGGFVLKGGTSLSKGYGHHPPLFRGCGCPPGAARRPICQRYGGTPARAHR